MDPVAELTNVEGLAGFQGVWKWCRTDGGLAGTVVGLTGVSGSADVCRISVLAGVADRRMSRG